MWRDGTATASTFGYFFSSVDECFLESIPTMFIMHIAIIPFFSAGDQLLDHGFP
jgi:hypothetical protein